MLTPTTKAADHDVPISPEEIVRQGLVAREDWDTVSSKASPPAGYDHQSLAIGQHFLGGDIRWSSTAQQMSFQASDVPSVWSSIASHDDGQRCESGSVKWAS